MSLTLKIKWQRLERTDPNGPTIVADEHVIFVPAERIDTHGAPGESANLEAWDQDDYGHYVSQCVVTTADDDGNTVTTSTPREGSRLISTTSEGGETSYWLVSEAWVLGPNGQTIERVAP